MEETRKLYPDLNAQVRLTLSDGEKDCLKNRSDMIKNKKKEIEEKIKHYEKLSRRYARVKTALVATGITLGSIAGISWLRHKRVCITNDNSNYCWNYRSNKWIITRDSCIEFRQNEEEQVR